MISGMLANLCSRVLVQLDLVLIVNDQYQGFACLDLLRELQYHHALVVAQILDAVKILIPHHVGSTIAFAVVWLRDIVPMVVGTDLAPDQ